ncbi:MAG: hypothetical protein HC848_09990 [Limnobacter sp.]|nr:hypothetical protein [Limnobacter sp.]
MHELLTGYRPFEGKFTRDIEGINLQIREYASTPSKKILPNDNSAVAHLLRSMLKREPDRATPQELLTHEAFSNLDNKEAERALEKVQKTPEILQKQG